MSVRPCRSSTLSVYPSDLNFFNIGARVGRGGPCSRDGASNSTAFLNLRWACSRRITCRALYSAMDKLFLFRGSFSRRRSRQSLRTSLIAGSCCSRLVFPRFTALRAMADLAMAVVSVPSAAMNCCVGPVHLVSRASWHAVVPFWLKGQRTACLCAWRLPRASPETTRLIRGEGSRAGKLAW